MGPRYFREMGCGQQDMPSETAKREASQLQEMLTRRAQQLTFREQELLAVSSALSTVMSSRLVDQIIEETYQKTRAKMIKSGLKMYYFQRGDKENE